MTTLRSPIRNLNHFWNEATALSGRVLESEPPECLVSLPVRSPLINPRPLLPRSDMPTGSGICLGIGLGCGVPLVLLFGTVRCVALLADSATL